MEEIFNSVDFIFITNDEKVLFVKRDSEPHENELALPGGIQNNFENFDATIIRILKKKLGLISEIVNNKIIIDNFGEYFLKQIKTYDSGNDIRGGNTTVFVIETDLDEVTFKKSILKEIYFYKKDQIPQLAFEHNKFIADYFFENKNYTVANISVVGVTVDIVIITVKDGLLKVLLTKRSKEPFKGYYTLPGGFVNKNISINNSALQILKRDTNIEGAFLEQLYTYGDLDRDSRGRIITVGYYALVDYSKFNIVYSKKYESLDWFSKSDLKKLNIGFDHKKIINDAIDRITNKIEYSNIAFQLLPEKFTLAELQRVYETILNKELDKRNFRKKIVELEMLEELEEYKKEGRMRPAKYHRFKERTKESILKAKSWI